MPDGGNEVSSFFDDLVPNSEVEKSPLTIPISDVIDWKSLLDHLRLTTNDPAHRYYVVTFRSIRSKGADDQKLYAADAQAQAEARQSGGLLMVSPQSPCISASLIFPLSLHNSSFLPELARARAHAHVFDPNEHISCK